MAECDLCTSYSPRRKECPVCHDWMLCDACLCDTVNEKEDTCECPFRIKHGMDWVDWLDWLQVEGRIAGKW